MVKSLSEGVYVLVLVVLHIMNTYIGAHLCTTDPIKHQQEFLGSQLREAEASAMFNNILRHYLLNSKLYNTFLRLHNAEETNKITVLVLLVHLKPEEFSVSSTSQILGGGHTPTSVVLGQRVAKFRGPWGSKKKDRFQSCALITNTGPSSSCPSTAVKTKHTVRRRSLRNKASSQQSCS